MDETMEKQRKLAVPKIRFTTTQIIMLTFLAVIGIGTLLLMLPVSTASGQGAPFLTALFTSTTSVCVTGLVVVDTYAYWSLFGKVVILLLIQVGGLGVITICSLALLMMRKRFSLGMKLVIRDYYNMSSLRGLIRFMKKVVKGTLLVEGVGAVLYAFILIPRGGFVKGLWQSVFTSVSAFCNAGIDIFGPDSLIPFQTNVPMNIITMLLIIFGGLGYVVWFDFIQAFSVCRRTKNGFRTFWSRLHEHTRLVISMTLILLITGMLLVFIGEHDNPGTIGTMSLGDKLMTSLFQSVTFRTAGFATVPQQALSPFTCIGGLALMFIGGSPAGTAGGVKTVTVAILLINVFTYIRQENETVIYGRRVTHEMVSKAVAIVSVSLTMTIVFIMVLLKVSDAPPMAAAYEIFSATGTVGLSRGLTSTLSAAGQVVVILAMYAGRVAPISMALFFTIGNEPKKNVRYPAGKFVIG